MVRSCLVAPETGRKRHLSRKQKGETGRGLVRNRTRVEPSLLVFVRLPSHRAEPTRTTSAPTSTRDGPHVGTHICARPLTICYFRISRTVSFSWLPSHNQSKLAVRRSESLGAMRSPSATRQKTSKKLVIIAATLLGVSSGTDVPLERSG
jgi:hypothetical protein